MAVVCALCKAENLPKERYRLREGIQKGGGPTELYCQLKTVVGDDLPAGLCSEVVCVACRGSIIKAAKQKERFEHSRKELVQKIHRFPVCSVSPKRAEATVKTPPRLPSKPEKRPRPSPLARTGVSPLTKRPPLAEAVQRDGKQPVEAAQRPWMKPFARRELFPVPTSVQVSPSRIPIPSTKSKASYPPSKIMGQVTLSGQPTVQRKVSMDTTWV